MDNLVYIRNDNFKKNVIMLYFPFKYEPGKSINLFVGCNLANTSTMKYKSEEELEKVCLDNYIYSITYNAPVYYEQGFICFKMVIPSEKELGEKILDKTFSLFKEIIYNPNVENEAFLENDFKMDIERRKNNISNCKKNIRDVAVQKVYKHIDPNGLGDNVFNHPEYLDSVTPELAYQYYKENIITKSPYICYFGDADKEEIEKLCLKYFSGNEIRPFNENKIDYLPLNDEAQEISENGPYNQSELVMVYKIKDMSKDDDAMLELISGLLSNQSTFILHNKLRGEYNLVYSTGSFQKSHKGILICVALISKENKEKAENAIKEVIGLLKDKEFIKPHLKNYKEKVKLDMLRDLDSINTLVDDVMVKYFDIDCSTKEYYEKISKISEDDIVKFMDRVILDLTCFVGGDK